MDHILGLPVGKYRDYEYSSSVLGSKVTVECIYQKKISNMSLPCALAEVKSTKNIIPILMHFYETQTDGYLQPTETQTDRYLQPTETHTYGYLQPTETHIDGYLQPTETQTDGYLQPTETQTDGY